MKKTYIIPAVATVNVVAQQQLMTVSGDGRSVSGFSDETGDLKDAAVKSSGYSVWDDDWSE